ncbi:MAG: NADH-quinone oxidoreductase subunit C [Candidatus Aminicenantes bacterium]
MEKQKITEILKKKFPEKILDIKKEFGDTVLQFRRDDLVEIMTFLQNKPQDYAMLLDLTCIDYLGRNPRFEMVYHVFSLSRNERLRLKCGVKEEDPVIDSLTGLWKNADWLEREVFDMFGIRFNGHPYLKRLFMYDGFEGHPLRKDYPLRRQQPKIPLKK